MIVRNLFNQSSQLQPTRVDKNMVSPNTNHVQDRFGNFLKNAIQTVNTTQLQADEATMKLSMGENIDLHNVMITAQKASITLQAALEIRNKGVEAYQEIMRMQV